MVALRVALALLLVVSPLAYSHTPAQPEPTQEELELMAQHVEEFLEMVKQVGGLYIVAVAQMPTHAKMAAFNVMKAAAEHDLCVEADPSAVIFKSVAGKVEAQKLKAALEKLGCTVELIEMPA